MTSVPAAFDRKQAHIPARSPRWLQVLSHIDPKFGGITAAVPELCGALTASGIDAAAAAFCGPEEQPNPHWPHPPERFPLGRLRWLTDSTLQARFRQTIAEASGLHIHGLWQEHCSVAAKAARAARKPYVVSAHGMLERWAIGNKSWKKRIYSALIEDRNLAGAACLHALTEAEAGDYRRAGLRNPVAIIPNGIHLPPAASPDLFFHHFPTLSGKRLVLFLSRIHFKKGLDLLTGAWHNVQAEVPDAHLVLAGPDFENTRSGIEKRIAELGMEDRVTFTGMLSGDLKWSALSAATLYVLPSYSEGFSVAILEAMAMGKPVLITRQCNFPEAETAQCGWQIEPSQNDLQHALLDALHQRPEELRERGQRGKRLVADRFTWSHAGAQMAALYRWIEGGPPAENLRILT